MKPVVYTQFRVGFTVEGNNLIGKMNKIKYFRYLFAMYTIIFDLN